MSLLAKLKSIKSNVTVEPVLAFFVIPSLISLLATQNLNLEKACRVNLGFGESTCNDLTLRKTANHTVEEQAVQKLIASVQGWRSVVHTAVPTVIMLFVGDWSDKTGRRKVCMLVPIVGEILTCALNLFNTYFFELNGVKMTAIMEVIFIALTGGWYTMMMATFSYIGDITTKESRTFRIGILNLCMSAGFPVGIGLSGMALRCLGYYGTFILSGSLHIIMFCYVWFRLEDHVWLAPKDKIRPSGCIGVLKEFFDIKCVKKTIGIVFKKGPNDRRKKMILVLVITCLTFGPMWGELSIMYIFTRFRFNWDEVRYSIFSAYSFVTHSLGTLFAVSVFSKKLKFDDAILGIIFAVSKILGSIIMAFARNDLEVYLAPAVEIFNGSPNIALRSIGSKMVANDELGKVFSLFGVAETLMPLAFTPLYTSVYILTLNVLPGAVFLISVLATTPSLIIFIWFYRQHKKDARTRLEDPVVLPINEVATVQEKTNLIATAPVTSVVRLEDTDKFIKDEEDVKKDGD